MFWRQGDGMTAWFFPELPAMMLASAAMMSGGHMVEVQGRQEFRVTDQRAVISRKNRLNSVWIWSCDFGVLSLGEDGAGSEKVGSNRIPALETLLRERAGELAGGNVEITRYWISFNGNAKMKGDSWGQALGGGALSTIVSDGKSRKASCVPEKMKSGWFGPGEITTPHTPLVVEIEGSFKGQRVSVRSVHSPERELISGSGLKRLKPEDMQWMREALLAANGKFAAALIAQARQ
jgi:hypothetical protein